MAKKKKYKIIITVTEDDIQREVIGTGVMKTEVIWVLETVKSVMINEMISN